MKRFKITLTLLLAALPMLLTAQPKVKYIFYFIGDGMGMGHVNAAEAYNRDVLGSQTPLLMMTFPYAGQVRTYSAINRKLYYSLTEIRRVLKERSVRRKNRPKE